jgi:hypothetical protein
MQQYIAYLIIRDVISSLVQISLHNEHYQSGSEMVGTNLLSDLAQSSRYRELNRFGPVSHFKISKIVTVTARSKASAVFCCSNVSGYGFESHSGHECVFVLSCRGRGLRRSDPPSREYRSLNYNHLHSALPIARAAGDMAFISASSLYTEAYLNEFACEFPLIMLGPESLAYSVI